MSGKGEHPGDPGRRLRRHRYQEGPGFLFLATQGGRPPGSPARATLREVRRRMRAVRLAAERGLEAAGAAGYSRRSVFRWTGLYKAGGIAALLPKSRARLEAQAAVPDWVSRVVIAIRLATYWNSKRIAAEMERRQIYKVGHSYIDELFKRHGCSRGSVAPTPGPRYERSQPNELWHIDIKGPFFIRLAGRGYLKTWLFGLVLDRHLFSSLAEAETALRGFADYYNFHRLSGTLGWRTPAERYLGVPFADRGFEHIPSLEHLQPWLEALMATAA